MGMRWAAAALLVALAAAEPVKIEHTELPSSHNPERTFCIRLKNVAADIPLQPTVMYRYHNDSQQLLLHQDDSDAEVFRGSHVFDGTGAVEYIITAGNVFWTPQNASFGTFEQLGVTTTTTRSTSVLQTFSAPLAAKSAHTAEHTIGDHNHYHSGWNSWAFVWIALALLFLSFIFFMM